jgi:hypothetical protein
MASVMRAHSRGSRSRSYSALAALLIGVVNGYSQGTVYLGDYDNANFQITIWSPQTNNPAVMLQGNSSADFGTAKTGTADIPPGAQDGYTGVALGGSDSGPVSPDDYTNGNLWSVQLYAAPGVDQPVSALSPVAGTIANFYTEPSVVGHAGLWRSTATATISTSTTGGVSPTGQPVTPFDVPDGSPATLAMAAWYNGGGAYGSFNEAVAAGVPIGFSTTGSENLSDPDAAPSGLPGPDGPNTLAGGITSFSLAVTARPIIIAQPQSLALMGTTNVTFSVAAVGATEYQWTFNGLFLPGGTNSSYSIGSVFPSSAGNYSVTVGNAAGVVSSTVALLLVQSPTNQTASAGSTAIFTAPALGHVLPSYQWQKNGSNFDVQWCASLAAPVWSNLVSVSNLPNSPATFLDPMAIQPVRFYRALTR